jgi:DNA-binding IclR family transcriptional regulator
MAGGSNVPGRTVISKVSLILLAISQGSRTLSEIAARSDLPLSTVHRLATDLVDWGVLERTSDGFYRGGSPLQIISSAAGSAAEEVDCTATSIRDRAGPVMEDLIRAYGARVRVGFFDTALRVAYLQKDSLHRPVSRDCEAARLPAHATAVGKALLAFSSPSVVKAVLARPLRQYTPFTVTNPRLLHAAFRAIRSTRLAVCDRELEWSACAVAAPVFGAGGQIAAAIELHTADLARDRAAWRAVLSMAAASLSREIARPPRFRAVDVGVALPDVSALA